ncbi:MAG TPA: metallophosphoesterase [Candidatus Nanoarchaeia archaeon]|nr:metallophosphoesterase [Candidatus Nanoarchaeia archaeon]
MKIEYVGKCLVVEEEGKKVLVIGDLHLGYEESLRRDGVFVPGGLVEETLKDLEEIFTRVGRVDEIVVLGDIKHRFSGSGGDEKDEVWQVFRFLRERGKKIIVTRGNHDTILPSLASFGVSVVDYYIVGGGCFFHGDRDFEVLHGKEIETWVMGHIHPAIMLREGAKEEKYKCFLEGMFKGRRVVIVPSFFGGNEGSDVRVEGVRVPWNFRFENFKVWVAGEGLEVLDFGVLGKI